jgi:predicted phosphodiesterase
VRVAAIYDVHGNLPALEAVLADIEAENVDIVVSGGDLVAGPFPAEVLALLESRADVRFLRGNADRLVLEGVGARAGLGRGPEAARRARARARSSAPLTV